LNIDKELCAFFIDWQKAFYHVNETKLMHILNETGIDWHERRLISKFYVDQNVKLKLDRGKTRSVKTGRGVRQGCCLSLILFNLYSEYLTIKVLEGSGDFIIGQVICTVKYADDLVLLAKEEAVLQGLMERPTELGRCYGMEVNVEKTKVMRISRQSSSIQIMKDQKQLENVEYFSCLGSMITNDAQCTQEIKSKIAKAKASFNKKRTLFTSKVDVI
jgi:hypothetical protein